MARALVLLLLLLACDVAAQTPTAEPSTSTVTVDAATLQDLPVPDDVFGALERMYGMVITDRFSGGGLSDAQPARVGGFLNSWTQTTIRIGDVDVTSPDGGVPLLVPSLLFSRRVAVTTASMPPDTSTPGLLIALEPVRPADHWTGMADGIGLPPALVSRPADPVPAIARPEHAFEGRGMVSGPLKGDRLGLVLAASVNQSAQSNRDRAAADASHLSSVFADLALRANARNTLSTIALFQAAAYPSSTRVPFAQPGSSDHDDSAHLQSTWERRTLQGAALRVFAGVTTQARALAPVSAAPATIERLTDGPVPTLTAPAGGTRRRWMSGIRFDTSFAPREHAVDLRMGFDAGRAAADVQPAYPVIIRELVDGLPAHEWHYSAPQDARRAMTTLAGFVSDRLAVSRHFVLDTSLRFDGVSGRARDASYGISWRAWLPRASIRWELFRRPGVAFFGGYTRSADALTFGALEFGDPAAPSADVYRWTGGAALGPIVARSGPGAAAPSAIDPALARPTTGEIDLGTDIHPARWMRVRYALTLKRETHELAVLDTGAPASSYSVSRIPDPGANLGDPRDDQLLPVYDRLPSSFGADRFMLTNSPEAGGTFGGQNLQLETSTTHLWLFAGAKTNIAKDRAGYRGFHAFENDPALLGELFTDPNALTHARGRPFTDRSYTVKIAGTYQFAHDVRLGVVVRYQDGQPYSRLVIMPDLAQGPEAIRAVDPGISRFTYTGTLDVRLQKGFTRAHGRTAMLFDIYNLPQMRKEVEEYVVTGPHFRDETVRQPPRTILVGLRFSV